MKVPSVQLNLIYSRTEPESELHIDYLFTAAIVDPSYTARKEPAEMGANYRCGSWL